MRKLSGVSSVDYKLCRESSQNRYVNGNMESVADFMVRDILVFVDLFHYIIYFVNRQSRLKANIQLADLVNSTTTTV